MNYLTLLFYKYTFIDEPEIFTKRHLKFCKQLKLTGRVFIANEGINGTVSGTEESCQKYMDELSASPVFKGIEFKTDEVDKPSFDRIHVRAKKEICAFGDKENLLNPNEMVGKYLEPKEFLKMKDEQDVIVLDARNKVEFDLGRFKNAISLDLKSFRDFPKKVNELEKYKGGKILAYCTGGIRCEKATAYLLKQGFKNVFHLQGGIIKYGKETGGKDFDGKCYVFDKRLSVDVNSVNPTVISKCYICQTPATRMVNCANPECNIHICMCENCGWDFDGACSKECQQHPRKRKYEGSGYYSKPSLVEINFSH